MTELNKVSQFATSMLNAATLDDLLWSIAENIGTTLGFDDCVVYLNIDNKLEQKAAFGIKNPNDRCLLNAILIPVGQGIVGTVAQTQTAEIVENTELDSRYINDEFMGKSEITIPVVYEDKTIAIIDSESEHVNFFNENHKILLQIIANIAAPRIASALYSLELLSTQKALKDANKKLVTSLSELKENQKVLIHSEKMASVGLLAAGVAHEINNPLGFSISNCEALANYCDDIRSTHLSLLNHPGLPKELKAELLAEDYTYAIDDLKNTVEETNTGLLRIKNIVSGLCSYVRNSDVHFSHFDINDGIKSALSILRGEINDECHLQLNLKKLPDIRANKNKIHQVFVNILLNALHAIENNGEITVKTYSNKNYACVDIVDNGSGIDNKNLQNVFTPFFTTKGVNKGTGLGLFICHQIITEEHTGKIKVTSVGHETKFCIMLPFANNATKPEMARVAF